MTGLDLRYDGIIYQLAGELLLDLDETREIRWRCPENYWISLNSFAFGQIFGRNLITLGEYRDGLLIPMRMVPLFQGGPSPAEMLFTEFFPQKRSLVVRSANAPSLEALIRDPKDPGDLKHALKKLEELVHSENTLYWSQYAVREAYLSFKPKGDEWSNENGAWQFEGRENFFYDQDKESEVPNDFVHHIRRHVEIALKKTLKKRKPPEGALEGYIRRNTVAHLAIHPTSNRTTDPDFGHPDSSARILHATRAALAGVEVDERLWRVQELTVPGLLKTMIEASAREIKPGRRRRVLIEKIQEASNKSDLDPLRTKLAEAVALAREQKYTLLKKLVSDLERISSERGATPETRILYVGDRQYEKAISVLAEMGAGRKDASWTSAFFKAYFRVFREMEPPRGLDQ